MSVYCNTTRLFSAAIVTGALAFAGAAYADPTNLVANGDFSDTSAFYNYNGNNVGSNVNNSNLASWSLTNCDTSTTCGFQFVVNTADLGSTGIYNQTNNQNNFFYGTPGTAPDGNTNAFLSDATYQTQALYQAVGNLKIGDTYTLSFYQASLQQTGFGGPAQNSWQVGLGNGSAYTVKQSDTMNNEAHSFTPWVQQTMTFVADATSEILYFFATSNNGAQPPFLLLDGVSLTDASVPESDVAEPATIAMTAVGFVGMLAARRRRRA